MERFASYDGTAIAYSVKGSGPDVLLVHGHGGNQVLNWIFPGVRDALVGAGRRVIGIDLRGHGDSDKPHDPAAYENEALRRDVQALLDHLGVTGVDVVGYSMGSLITVQLACSDTRVRTILLGGAGMPGDSGRDTRMTTDPEAVYTAASAAELADPDARRLREFLDVTGADRLSLLAMGRAAPGGLPRVDLLDMPCLILTGADDDVVGSPQLLADLIPGARVELLPGDHLTVLADPGFVPAIVRWLDAVSPVAA